MVRGKYIAIEGGNGAGLTTQVALLVERLHSQGIEAAAMEEPGGTAFAQKLSSLIKTGPERSAKTNVLAFNASRADSLRVIEEQLANGIWVISDRSYLSTVVYQGYGEGQDIEAIRHICEYAIADTEPDLILILEVRPEIAAERLVKGDVETDYFEDMNSQFHDRVREGYRQEAKSAGYRLVDANSDQTTVAETIWTEVKPLLKSKTTFQRKRPTSPSAPSTLVDSVIQLETVSNLAESHIRLAVSAHTSEAWHFDHDTLFEGESQRYYTPPNLKAETEELYHKSLQAILDSHTRLVRVLANYLRQTGEVRAAEGEGTADVDHRKTAHTIAQAILPVAVTNSISLPVSQLKLVATQLGTNELVEVQELVQPWAETASTAPAKTTDNSLLGHSLDFNDKIALRHTTFHNELDLLPYIFYSSSPLSLRELRSVIAAWPVGQKIETLTTQLKQAETGGLPEMCYTWDVMSNYREFRNLLRVNVGSLTPQQLTPRYGYSMPQIIEDAGLEELFEKAFEMSFLLYDILMHSGYPIEAQYATLHGHKMRFKLTQTIEQAKRLAQTQDDWSFMSDWRERLAEMHPLIFESFSSDTKIKQTG